LRVNALTQGDAERFVRLFRPACVADEPTSPCWTPPAGVSSAEAVGAVDEVFFQQVLPGTQVVFRLELRNDGTAAGRRSQLSRAALEARAGPLLLQTLELIVAVPAASEG
jgi:hypothetical protein